MFFQTFSNISLLPQIYAILYVSMLYLGISFRHPHHRPNCPSSSPVWLNGSTLIVPVDWYVIVKVSCQPIFYLYAQMYDEFTIIRLSN